MSNKFSVDEKDIIANFYVSDTYACIVKVLEDILRHQENKVLSYDLQRGANGLVEEKARAEGAQRMLRDFIALKEKYRVEK